MHQIAGQDSPRAGRVPCSENGRRPWALAPPSRMMTGLDVRLERKPIL